MLIYAKFKNLLSFDQDGIEFSMVAAGKVKKNSHHVVQMPDTRVLKGALVIGPNASGKSNLVKAFRLLKQMVGEGNCCRARGKQFGTCAKGKNFKSAPSTWDVVYHKTSLI